MSNDEENGEKKVKRLGLVEHIHSVRGQNRTSTSDNEEDVEVLKEELEATKERLGERESQLGAIALKAFEEEKKELVDAVKKDLGNEKAREISEKITNPKQLEDVKAWIGVFSKAFKKYEDSEMEGGQDLSKTGGQIPLYTPAQQGKSGIKGMTVKQIYDRYEKLLFKKETGKGEPMSDDELKEFQKLDDAINKLWYQHIKPAILEKRPAYRLQASKTTICPKCGSVIAERICPFCGKEVMSQKEWLARRG